MTPRVQIKFPVCHSLRENKEWPISSRPLLYVSIVFFLTLLPAWNLCAQQYGDSAITTDAQQRFLSQPSFTTFHDNYFTTGTSLNHWPNKNNSDIKYQISFKQLLYRRPVIEKSFLFVSYTQKSFWDVYKMSKPFSEINFNPALGLIRPYNTKKGNEAFLTLMLEHESNGRDSSASRSWNFLSLGWVHNVNNRLQLNAKAWVPFAYKDDNPDLLHYVGYGQVGASYILKPQKWYMDVLVKKGNQWNLKGSLQTQLYYKPFQNGNQFIGLQWFQGYGENLIDYSTHTSMLRIGLIIKPNLVNFFY